MDESSFHAVVSTLLSQLGVEDRIAPDGGDVFTVSVGPVDIELVGSQPGFINFLCFPGDLQTPSVESLSLLLASNRYQEADPVITVSLLDTTPAKVSIWSRLPLSQADPSNVANLFVRFTELAHATQNWINAGSPGLKNDGALAEPGKQEVTGSVVRRAQDAGDPSSTQAGT
ncbi:MAG TPA: hypothetical protein VGE12_01005 [Noviherbaspirillum sp.]